MDSQLVSRSVNEGFSGGEREEKRDIPDGDDQPAALDIGQDRLGTRYRRVEGGGRRVNKLQTKENATILITHYQRLLEYIKPDKVHVLYDGKVVKSGGPDLALELEKRGYDWLVTP